MYIVCVCYSVYLQQNPACTALAGMLVAAVLGVAAANQEYMSDHPRPFWPNARRAYWDKQTAYLDDQDDQDSLGQSEAQQVKLGGRRARHTSRLVCSSKRMRQSGETGRERGTLKER